MFKSTGFYLVRGCSRDTNSPARPAAPMKKMQAEYYQKLLHFAKVTQLVSGGPLAVPRQCVLELGCL